MEYGLSIELRAFEVDFSPASPIGVARTLFTIEYSAVLTRLTDGEVLLKFEIGVHDSHPMMSYFEGWQTQVEALCGPLLARANDKLLLRILESAAATAPSVDAEEALWREELSLKKIEDQLLMSSTIGYSEIGAGTLFCGLGLAMWLTIDYPEKMGPLESYITGLGAAALGVGVVNVVGDAWIQSVIGRYRSLPASTEGQVREKALLYGEILREISGTASTFRYVNASAWTVMGASLLIFNSISPTEPSIKAQGIAVFGVFTAIGIISFFVRSPQEKAYASYLAESKSP
jgi:hypothetical protein